MASVGAPAVHPQRVETKPLRGGCVSRSQVLIPMCLVFVRLVLGEQVVVEEGCTEAKVAMERERTEEAHWVMHCQEARTEPLEMRRPRAGARAILPRGPAVLISRFHVVAMPNPIQSP